MASDARIVERVKQLLAALEGGNVLAGHAFVAALLLLESTMDAKLGYLHFCLNELRQQSLEQSTHLAAIAKALEPLTPRSSTGSTTPPPVPREPPRPQPPPAVFDVEGGF